jgi:hypothetical protein
MVKLWASWALFFLPALVDATVCVEHSILGCYAEPDVDNILNMSSRVLNGFIFNANEMQKGVMTHDFCMQECNDRGFKLAGVEDGSQCFCGDYINTKTASIADGCKVSF